MPPKNINKRFLKKLLAKDGPVILEVGAHVGVDSVGFLDTFPACRLFCFEPDPRNVEIHRECVCDERCVLVSFAVSNTDGETTLYLSTSDYTRSKKIGSSIRKIRATAASTIKEPNRRLRKKRYPNIRFEETIVVPTIRLDTWFATSGLDMIDLIWADVQGAEGDLIDGGRTALSKTRFLYTEFSKKRLHKGQVCFNGIMKRLHDFDLLAVYGTNALLKNKSIRV